MRLTNVRHPEQPGEEPVTEGCPDLTVLESLSSDERLVLWSLLRKPVEYMDHPALHEPEAERALFGGPAKLVSPNAFRFVRPEAVVAGAAGNGRRPLPTSEQGRKLFLRYNYARMRIRLLQDQFAATSLTAPATRELLAWAHRALETRSTIAETNLALVKAMMRRSPLASIDDNEMLSDGHMALLRSIDKYDCGRGVRFGTYACRAILMSFSSAAKRARRYRSLFPVAFDPALEESDHSERRRVDTESLHLHDLNKVLLRNRAALSPVERTVIRERFGLRSVKAKKRIPKTLALVGLMVGLSKERVRQIQNIALRKIRAALEHEIRVA